VAQRRFSNTALIVGAGAHVPYGFPTAYQLTEKIKSLYKDAETITSIEPYRGDSDATRHKQKICSIIRQLNLVPESESPQASNSHEIAIGRVLDRFITAFGQSQMYSIDAYLSKILTANKDANDSKRLDAQIGKLLIAYLILDAENLTPIGFHSPDWIQFLINKFLRSPKILEDFRKNPPRIISFNYDNLLEKSICAHLKSYHGFSHEESLKYVLDLNILHVYGDLDTLRVTASREVMMSAIDRLQVIGEERVQNYMDQVSMEIAERLNDSTKVYFLGFGFDELNAQLLFDNLGYVSDASRASRKFYATNIGMTKYSIAAIHKKYRLGIRFFIEEEVDCFNLISVKAPIF